MVSRCECCDEPLGSYATELRLRTDCLKLRPGEVLSVGSLPSYNSF
jgi:hypothetical protein